MYIIIVLLIIVIFSLIFYNKKKFENQEKEFYNKQQKREENIYQEIQNKVEQEFVTKRRQELEEYLLIETANARDKANLEHANEMARLREKQQQLEAVIKTGEETIRQLEIRKEEQTKLIEEAINDKKKIVDTEIAAYREVETQKAATAVTQWAATARSQEEASLCLYKDEVALTKQNLQAELLLIQSMIGDVKEELEDYRKKQQAVNEAILRQRELDEKQDFYRVKLTDDAKQDIKYLISIVDNIKNSALLYKLIWSEYIQKPFGTMLKNVTGGKEIKCVIYKITNTNTQEIYIGKTKADVTKRWTEHIKTSLNIGTVARSKIHDALFRHWDEFTFEILEEVSDESKLSQREKYYINFYQSNIYGYNMNSGG